MDSKVARSPRCCKRKTNDNLNRMAKKNDCSNMNRGKRQKKESSSTVQWWKNAKLAVPDETVTLSKLLEDYISKAELILFLDELDDSQQSKTFSHHEDGQSNRWASNQKRKKLRVEQRIALIVVASATHHATVPVSIEEHPFAMYYRSRPTNLNFYSLVDRRGIRGKVVNKTEQNLDDAQVNHGTTQGEENFQVKFINFIHVAMTQS